MGYAGVAMRVGPDVEAVAVSAAGACRQGRLQRDRIKQLLALPAPPGQHQRHPARHVGRAGAGAAGGRLGVRLALGLLHDIAGGLGAVAVVAQIGLHMAPGAVAARLQVGVARAGVRHAQWLVQGLFGQRGPVGAQGPGQRLGGGGQAKVGVGIAAVGVEWHQAQTCQHLLARIAQVFELIARVVGQATAVGKQIAQGQASVVLRVGVGQCEAGQKLLDGRAPARIGRHARGHDGGGERLGHRSQRERRVGIHQGCFIHPAHAEAACVDRAPVVHHRHGHAGHAGARHPLRHQGVEPRGGLMHGGIGGIAAAAGNRGRSGQGRGGEAKQAGQTGAHGLFVPHALSNSSSSQSIDTAAE